MIRKARGRLSLDIASEKGETQRLQQIEVLRVFLRRAQKSVLSEFLGDSRTVLLGLMF